jgi:hypothetical protein
MTADEAGRAGDETMRLHEREIKAEPPPNVEARSRAGNELNFAIWSGTFCAAKF